MGTRRLTPGERAHYAPLCWELHKTHEISLSNIARHFGWFGPDGVTPSRGMVQRLANDHASHRIPYSDMPQDRPLTKIHFAQEPTAVQTPPMLPVYVRQPPARNRDTAPRVYLRAAVVDIETTDFGTEGFSGYLICVCILPLDAEKPITLHINFEESGDDRKLLTTVVKALSRFDILIGHNWRAFDANWLESRLMFHRMSSLHAHMTYDTYQAARALALKTGKSLGNLIDYFSLEGEKTSIRRTSWNDIRSPNRDEFDRTLKNIIYHCEQDVISNRNLFDILYPRTMMLRGAGMFKPSKIVG
jgi:hypothetical protein